MATSFQRNKNRQRPKKSPAERARRMKNQQKRVIAMGVPEEKARKATAPQLRAMLRCPPRPAK
jgi:hypothetical protein